jgi:hypothetical protein
MKIIIMLFAFLEGQKHGMKTMKSFLIALGILGIVIFATINVAVNENTPFALNMTLQNMEAYTNESEGSVNWGCGGNPTYIPHQTLKSRVCIAFWRTHLVCKTHDNVCCDPGGQTDCNGDLPDISF